MHLLLEGERWRDKDNRYDLEFWKQEEELFSHELLQHEGLFEGLEGNVSDGGMVQKAPCK